MKIVPFLSAHGRARWIHNVGGGPMGLLAAIEQAWLARSLGFDVKICIYENQTFGGAADDRTSAPRSQLWLHSDGQLWASTQPDVCVSLQQSTCRLRYLVPHAFAHPLALAIEPADGGPALAECFRALGVWHKPVLHSVVKAWFPMLRLPPDCRLYRVRDAVMDLRILSYSLAARARRIGVRLVRQGVQRVELQGETVRSLVLANGERVGVAPSDTVVLTCSSTIRPLLAEVGISVPGFTVVRSHLIATDVFQLPVLLAAARGGPNCVPHSEAGMGTLNVFGSSDRSVCPPESDNKPLRSDPEAVKRICREAEEWFGLKIPNDCLSWPARKAEIVPSGDARSQAHHCLRVLHNCYLALPGKISQTAATGQNLAKLIFRNQITDEMARPVWETLKRDQKMGVKPDIVQFTRFPRKQVAALAASLLAFVGTILVGSDLF